MTHLNKNGGTQLCLCIAFALSWVNVSKLCFPEFLSWHSSRLVWVTKRCSASDLGDGNKQQPCYFYTQTICAGDTGGPGPAGSSCLRGTAAGHLQPAPDLSSTLYSGQVHIELHYEECQTPHRNKLNLEPKLLISKWWSKIFKKVKAPSTASFSLKYYQC